jgi:hypothetical protein
MARPKRMGAYNALDDLLPGAAWDPGGSPGDPGAAWDLGELPSDPGPARGDPGEPADAGAGSGRSRRPRLTPVPEPPRTSRRRPADRPAGPNALDDLLPGPRRLGALEDLLPGPDSPPHVGGAPRLRSAGRHLGVWNPLDDLPPPASSHDPTRSPAKARVGFRLPADLVEGARDAVAHLAGTGDQTTLTALAERALRAELARLAATHNRGHPFPPRAR